MQIQLLTVPPLTIFYNKIIRNQKMYHEHFHIQPSQVEEINSMHANACAYETKQSFRWIVEEINMFMAIDCEQTLN